MDGTANGTGVIGGDATNGLDVDVTRVGGTVTVDGSGVTQPVSAASLPLPTGASTAAKQPALGTAGTASSDVITVQGIASMTALVVDGSGVTQPVSGTVTANLGATDNAVLDQIELNTSYGDNTGGGTETGALRVTIANNSTGVVSVDDNGASLTVDVGTALPAGDNNIGNVDLASAIPAGTNNIGDVDVASIAAGTNTIGNVGLIGRTSGGMTIFRSIDIDESEEEIKASAGQVFSISAFNTTAAPLYLKFYNATAANVTVGTTTPVLTFPVPANADSDGAGFTLSIPNGVAFSTAITIAATTAVGDADTGAPGDNALIVNLGYA